MNYSECGHPILKRLVETPSIYPNEEEVSRVAKELLIEHGFSVIEQNIDTVYENEKGKGRKIYSALKD